MDSAPYAENAVRSGLPLIAFRNVGKRFSGVAALRGVTFTVAVGSCHPMIPLHTLPSWTSGALLAGLLFGCGKAPATDQASASRTKEYVFALIAKNQGNPVFQAARIGAEDAPRDLTQELGVPVKAQWQTPNEDDAQKQVEFLEQMVAQGVDGVSLSCVIADTVTPAIDKAVEYSPLPLVDQGNVDQTEQNWKKWLRQ